MERKPTGPAPPHSLSFRGGLGEIYSHMLPARRRHMYVLLVLMVLNAGAELATIGAVLPLLALISHPEALNRYPWVLRALGSFGGSSAQLLAAATVIFCAAAIVGGGLRVQLSRSSFMFAYELAHELTLEIQRRVLLQPYSFHVQRNSSTLISALDKANLLVFDVVLPLMQALIGGFIAIFVIAALIAVDPVIGILATIAFSVIYFIISTFAKRRLAADSAAIATALDGRLKAVQESLGGIREVIIDGSQSSYLAAFERENSRLSRARASVAITSATPRYLIEAAGMVAIAGIALAAFQREGGLGAAIPALGAIALGAQRLMPLVQQVYRGWSTASGHLSLVAQTTELLNLPAEQESQSSEGPRLTLADRITVSGVGFSYPGRRNSALRRIHFEIPAGSALGVIGETGSGKTTLVDLLMGLMEPDEGHVLVDGVRLTTANRRSWQRSIAHVPQSIFLADATIWRNIGLSLPNLAPDQDRIVDAAKKAQLHDFIMSLPGEYETIVGERGIRLSGGQRQRLGLARAIYKDAPVFVLDEATSALDDATEDAVMGALDSLRRQGRTLIIVAHRISTISRCDWIARLDDGRLAEFGGLNEVLATDQIYAEERRSRSTFD